MTWGSCLYSVHNNYAMTLSVDATASVQVYSISISLNLLCTPIIEQRYWILPIYFSLAFILRLVPSGYSFLHHQYHTLPMQNTVQIHNS